MNKSDTGNISQAKISSKPSRKPRKSRRSGKLKKQDKIHILITNYGRKNIPISFKQIAKIVGCTETYVKITVAKLVKIGKVIKTKTTFISKKYKKPRVLCGKNLYTLPPTLNESCAKKINPKFLYISSKEEIAREQALRNSSKEESFQDFSGREEKVSVLKRFGFEDLAEKAPDWWFKDLKKLQKALSLLKKKLKTGWRCRNKINFTSFLLKRGIFGFSRHVAKDLSLSIAKPSLERVEKFLEPEPRRLTYEGLVSLHKNHGLNISFSSMQKLMRKKFGHLIAAVEVCHKRLQWNKGEKIRNINAFLNYLVGLENPHDFLKRKEAQ